MLLREKKKEKKKQKKKMKMKKSRGKLVGKDKRGRSGGSLGQHKHTTGDTKQNTDSGRWTVKRRSELLQVVFVFVPVSHSAGQKNLIRDQKVMSTVLLLLPQQPDVN